MHPAQVAGIKQRVLRADTRKLQGVIERTLQSEDPQAFWSTLGVRADDAAEAIVHH
jgi:phosphotransferase system enzyme I (PtsI)